MATRIDPLAQEAIARSRFTRSSPTKVRQVVDLIRGRHVEDARRVLRFSQRSASDPVLKVLESAIANAEHNRGLPTDELVVSRAWVDEGPTLRRFRPRALGRATRIRKRTCHISIVVTRMEQPVPSRPEPADAPRRQRRRGSGAAEGSQGRRKTTARKSTSEGASGPSSSPRDTAASPERRDESEE
jgi:large subunit ribosomal protein L22